MTFRRIEVRTARPYAVLVGPGAYDELLEHALGNCALIADRAAWERHGELLVPLHDVPRLVLEGGEGSKTLERLGEALDFLVEAGLDRQGTLVVFGGGAVIDVGGLAASLFMRGVTSVLCPTTLLAQVDASVGGKTAINLRAGKNLAGTFHQPGLVLADPRPLATLPPEEWRSGMGEVIKTALVGAPELFDELERTPVIGAEQDPQRLARRVEACVGVKGEIVAEDEREAGRRAVLNLGHTFAHTIELAAGFGTIPHGEAVGTGLVLAAEASRRAGVLAEPELTERIAAVVERHGLCASLSALRDRHGVALPPAELEAGLRVDKKTQRGGVRFVLLEGLGRARTGCELEGALVSALLSA